MIKEAKVMSSDPNKAGTVATNGVKSNYLFQCRDIYLVTTYYDESGNVISTDRRYLGRQGNCGTPEEPQVPQGDEPAGNEISAEYAYSKVYPKTWIVTTLNELGIYKTTIFTVYDDFAITGINSARFLNPKQTRQTRYLKNYIRSQ